MTNAERSTAPSDQRNDAPHRPDRLGDRLDRRKHTRDVEVDLRVPPPGGVDGDVRPVVADDVEVLVRQVPVEVPGAELERARHVTLTTEGVQDPTLAAYAHTERNVVARRTRVMEVAGEVHRPGLEQGELRPAAHRYSAVEMDPTGVERAHLRSEPPGQLGGSALANQAIEIGVPVREIRLDGGGVSLALSGQGSAAEL